MSKSEQTERYESFIRDIENEIANSESELHRYGPQVEVRAEGQDTITIESALHLNNHDGSQNNNLQHLYPFVVKESRYMDEDEAEKIANHANRELFNEDQEIEEYEEIIEHLIRDFDGFGDYDILYLTKIESVHIFTAEDVTQIFKEF